MKYIKIDKKRFINWKRHKVLILFFIVSLLFFCISKPIQFGFFKKDGIKYRLANTFNLGDKNLCAFIKLNKLKDYLDYKNRSLFMIPLNKGSFKCTKLELSLFKGLKILDEKIEGGIISSDYGRRKNPFLYGAYSGGRKSEFHYGIDYKAYLKTPLIWDRKEICMIKSVYYNCWYGRTVRIMCEKYDIILGHLNKIFVKNRQIVKKGLILGLVGSSGRSTGSHVHFEIREKGRKIVNPRKYFKGI